VLASGVLRWLYPDHATLGATRPGGTPGQSFVLEFLLTWFLDDGHPALSTGAKEKGLMAGVAVGAVIALEALFAGPACGASMNPARSFAPACVSRQWDHLWVYLTAPPLGAVVAVIVDNYLKSDSDMPSP
jgi:aquaporin Z